MQQYWYDLCEFVASLVLILRTSIRKANLFGYKLEISKHFCSFQNIAIGLQEVQDEACRVQWRQIQSGFSHVFVVFSTSIEIVWR